MYRTYVNDEEVASKVESVTSTTGKLRGYMLRNEPGVEEGKVFEFDSVRRRSVHMLFVTFPLEVVWIEGDTVVATDVLKPWTGYNAHEADKVLELCVGAATTIEPGDTIRFEERDDM